MIARRGVVAVVLSWIVGPLACGGDDGGAAGTDAATVGGDGSSGTPSSSTEVDTGATSSHPTSTSATTTTSPMTTDTADSSEDSASDSTGDPDANGCPAGAPSAWVGCETFDDIDDPAAQLPQWMVIGDGFGVEADGPDLGDRALRVTLVPGQQFRGWVTLRVGEGPDGPGVDSPTARFDELWVRYWLRTGDDWPGWGIGDVGELMVLDGANWGIAAEMAIRSETGQTLHPLGWSCIVDGVNMCNGGNDWSGGLYLIWQAMGETVLFDAAGAGQWRCVEGHMRLNTPGAADGQAHVWVDGNEEIAVDGVDFLGTWDEYGLNGLRFTNYATPPPRPLDFWVDDVVFATERVGCD